MVGRAALVVDQSRSDGLGGLGSLARDLCRSALCRLRGLGGSLGGSFGLLRQIADNILCGAGVLEAINLVRAIVADKVCQGLYGAVTVEVDRVLLVSGLVQLDRGEALDLVWDVVEGSVDLGNNDLVRVRGEESSELVVFGSETGR